ncbi:MFS transporter [Thermocrinis sp.]|jgi:MFS family permease|uniref:MFS transporter n=1 Tax=Thermocrinis sp. TaxID=2024383 RepID=UPI00260C9FAA|nr:MFS transporter [Thermocrinis sp.]
MRFIYTDLTCRLDALPWTGFHTRFVLALGITWVLDAFEVVIVSAVLKPMAKALQFTTQQASLMVSGFLIGAILGSLVFGYLADRFGRKKLFILTLLLYAGGTFLTGFANSFESAFFFRILAGAGLGGEFAAIQSAIDEFVPARHRGKVDGTITALWNLGSIMASLSALYLLKQFDEGFAWRIAFFIGGLLTLLIIYIRIYVPESPRWLISKGRLKEAEEIVKKVEREAGISPKVESCQIPVFEGSIWDATKLILTKYRWRFLFSASMSFTILTTYYGMITFLPLGLSKVYNLSSKQVSEVLFFGSVGGLIGGLVVAFLNDRVGRKVLGVSISGLSALAVFLFLLTDANPKVLYFLYSLIAFSFASVAYVIATEIYPSYIRAYAIGVLSVLGRLSGAFAPVLVIALANQDYRLGLLCISLFWLVGFFAFVIYAIKGKETKGMPIEQIS